MKWNLRESLKINSAEQQKIYICSHKYWHFNKIKCGQTAKIYEISSLLKKKITT